ncbi:hypothetical protein AB1Y20_022502 [Prymnesium parvum]|uniref:Cytochrome b561 domain-containing protein n=1 Tax=Prymnesium parvum TaxID=97485 RepID=A0AB34JJ12_PRYPA
MNSSESESPGNSSKGPSPSHHGFDNTTLLHAYLSVLAFVVLFPLAGATARYADKSRDTIVSPSKTWLRVHRGLAWAGLGCVVGGLVFMEWHKVEGGHPHLHSAHALWGAAAYVLASFQIALSVLRPARTVPPTLKRRLWKLLHVLAAVSIFITGLVATWLGVEKGISHGASYSQEVMGLFQAVLVVGAILFAALEFARCQGYLSNAPWDEKARLRAIGDSSTDEAVRRMESQPDLPSEVELREREK